MRITVGKEILDRAYGKPFQQLDDLTEDRLNEWIRHWEEWAAGAGEREATKRAIMESMLRRSKPG